MKVNAMDIILNSRRFDLIFKYIYLKNRHKNNNFYEKFYLEHIRAFNNFIEIEPSDGIEKKGEQAFLNAFEKIYQGMKDNGFDSHKGIIPIGDNGEISDGAHRLASAAVLNLEVELKKDGRNDCYDYSFFQERHINQHYADFAALEYVKINNNAYIINLHSVTDTAKDGQVEKILEKFGFIFYKKNVQMSFNGYVNLKKLSYGSFWEREEWIGTQENKFAGAQEHAKRSIGKSPLRVYIFVCDDVNKVIKAKAEIRELFNIGNYSVHINDTREESLWLAQIYFNENSLDVINKRYFVWEDERLDNLIDELKKEAIEQYIDLDCICGAGSTSLDIYGVRKSDDLDFLYVGAQPFVLLNEDISNHDSELKYYPYDKSEIIYNPKNYFYYHGLKFISLDVLYKMKQKRAEKPKDIDDCKMIEMIKTVKTIHAKSKFKFFEKIKNGNQRQIILLGFIKFSYKKQFAKKWKIKTTPKNKIESVSIHLAEHCNLNCQSCDNFSPLASEEFLDIETFTNDIKKLSEIAEKNIDEILLTGGEPLLNPDIKSFFVVARKYFPNQKILLITNAILLPLKKEDFWISLKENKISLAITKYPLKINYENIENKVEKYGIFFEYYNNKEVKKTSFHLPFDLEGGRNVKENFAECYHANNCIQLYHGKLFTCSILANVHHFNKYFKKQLPIDKTSYINIYETSNFKELQAFLVKPPSLCQYCAVDSRSYDHPWQISKLDIREWSL